MSDEDLDNMMLEPENSDQYEPDYIDLYKPDNIDLYEPENSDLDELENSDLDKPKNSDFMIAFIIEELQPFSIIQSRSFKRIIEGLDTQANILSNDHLKEILINSENKILQDLSEYVLDSAEISYVSFIADM
ncbi:4089_t:CDS:2 [Racocetra fulgida]|uniref:4089_t:CDS:1 n=1 Tax=Racocetra fulgida TaxID=60492 RepID=A0A9N9B9A0_9GLOM|nr:4089_t:CDS:2 [Racocetra fulgida]